MVSSEPINAPDGSLLVRGDDDRGRDPAEALEFTQQLLARAGELFGASTDYHQTVQAVSRVVVPQLADWCSVNIPDETGTSQQVALAHRDPEMVAWARRWSDRYPLHMDERSRLMGSDSLGSTVAVPMTAGAKIVGVLVFGNDPGSRSFDQSDLRSPGRLLAERASRWRTPVWPASKPTSRESCNAACGRRSSRRCAGSRWRPCTGRLERSTKWAATSTRRSRSKVDGCWRSGT